VSGADDRLLHLLADALAPEPVEPSPGELAHLYRAVTTPRPAARHRPRSAVASLRRPIPAIAAAFVLLSGGTAVALTGPPLPRPVRAVAHDVGLPVDSPELADARGATSHLEHALEAREAKAVQAAADRLEKRLRNVHGDERAEIEREAQKLLDRANASVATPPAATPLVPPTKPAPTSPAPTVRADDRGASGEERDKEQEKSSSTDDGSSKNGGSPGDRGAPAVGTTTSTQVRSEKATPVTRPEDGADTPDDSSSDGQPKSGTGGDQGRDQEEKDRRGPDNGPGKRPAKSRSRGAAQ
jgi:hypothetical protein